jgi:hypothetical protein
MRKIQVVALGILLLWGYDKGQLAVASSGNSTSSNSAGTRYVAKARTAQASGISAWHWGSDSNSYGINNVVGHPQMVNRMVAQYKTYNVRRLYGGYAKMPGYRLPEIACWNRRLMHEGIASIYLTGDAQWIYPQNRAAMLREITSYYVSFNKSVDDSSKLQGLHVDIEPHQLDEWASASPQRKRQLLMLLKDTYRDIKHLLLANNISQNELTADIPVWFDSVAAIGWTSEADRNAWFTDAGQYVSGFTLMAYEVKSIETIVNRTSWERTNFPGKIEVGLNIGDLGTTWASKAEFLKTLATIHAQTNHPVALHSFAEFLSIPANS